MNWLRNNMGIISSVSESAQLAASISDNEAATSFPPLRDWVLPGGTRMPAVSCAV